MEWKKGTKALKSGEKYQMKQTTSVNELLISKAVPEDSGEYSCVCGDQKTTASVNIKGRRSEQRLCTYYDFFSQCACHCGLPNVASCLFVLERFL